MKKDKSNLDEELKFAEKEYVRKKIKEAAYRRFERDISTVEKTVLPLLLGGSIFLLTKIPAFLLLAVSGFVFNRLDKLINCIYKKSKIFGGRVRVNTEDEKVKITIGKTSKDYFTEVKKMKEAQKIDETDSMKKYREAQEAQIYYLSSRDKKDKKAIYRLLCREIDLYYTDYKLPDFWISDEELVYLVDQVYEYFSQKDTAEETYDVLSNVFRLVFARALINSFDKICFGDLIAGFNFLKEEFGNEFILALQKKLLDNRPKKQSKIIMLR